MEHRWGQRVATNITTRVGEISGSSHLARLADLSVSGAFLLISLPVSELNPIFVELPSASPSPKRGTLVEAYVVRRTEAGVGIEWAELGPIPVVQLLAALNPVPGFAANPHADLRQSG